MMVVNAASIKKSRQFVRTLSIAVMLFCLSSCTKDYLKGYDSEALFKVPSAEELQEVESTWQLRNLAPAGYMEEAVYSITSSGTVLKMVSFEVNGLKEYGALLIPVSNAEMPVRMWIGGFDYDNKINSINIVYDATNADEPFVFAIPALRGQSLSITINGNEYTTPLSEGNHCDAFDGAADDVIAFLNIIEDTIDNADTKRVGVRGGSRGATVAMLVAERDQRVKLTVSVAGPVNMLEMTSKSENDLTYQCQFLEGLINGTATFTETRQKLIASSPFFFSGNLSPVQLHLATDDMIVPLSEGTKLMERMSSSAEGGPLELYIYDGRDHANIATDNPEMEKRIHDFFSDL